MINAMNKSKQSDSPSLGEGGERLSLLELNALVRRSLEQCLPDEYWIQAELSDDQTIWQVGENLRKRKDSSGIPGSGRLH